MKQDNVTWNPILSSAELCTIRTALIFWRVRAESDAEVMEKLGQDPTFDQEKANANARASRYMAAEASALLEKLDQEPATVHRSSAEIVAELMAEAPIAATLEDLEQRDPFAPGAVWSSKWGYEQTNCDFYRVVKRAGAWLTLEPIASIEQSDDTEERPATMTGKVVPADPVQAIGKTFRRKVAEYTSGPFVKIRSYSYAHPWDGHPERVSHYG